MNGYAQLKSLCFQYIKLYRLTQIEYESLLVNALDHVDQIQQAKQKMIDELAVTSQILLGHQTLISDMAQNHFPTSQVSQLLCQSLWQVLERLKSLNKKLSQYLHKSHINLYRYTELKGIRDKKKTLYNDQGLHTSMKQITKDG